MPATAIRRLTLGDLPALVALEIAAQQDEPWTPQALREELEHVDGDVLGLFLGAELLGHVCLRRMLDELWVLNLATHPDHRRTGVASRLLAAASERAAATSTTLWLEVREGNTAARALYAQAGFELVESRPDDSLAPGLVSETWRLRF